jgi:hypothetical protein
VKYDMAITNGREHTSAEWLREQSDIEHEPDPALSLLQNDAITRFIEVRDHGRMAQLLRLTPAMWKAMDQIERRLMFQFAESRMDLLQVKIDFMTRNGVASEPETPEFLRANGAA